MDPESSDSLQHITSCTQEAYSSITDAITSSNVFKRVASRDNLTTFTNFNIIKSHLGKGLVVDSNKILITESPCRKLKDKDLQHNIEIIIDFIDSTMDRVGIMLDTLNNLKLGAESEETVPKKLDAIATAKTNSYQGTAQKRTLYNQQKWSCTNVIRPQLNFMDGIDNSTRLWVPKLIHKPNEKKSLSLRILYNKDGVAFGHVHPYKTEIDMYTPPTKFIKPDTDPPYFPLNLQDTRYTYVDTESVMEKLVDHLNIVEEIAVDVEHHSYRSYQGITCLIQITTMEGGDFIIDTLALRDHIHKLNSSFTDPTKIKVFHGAKMDVRWLQRDFGVYIVGLFDTYYAARLLKFRHLSLKYLLMKYCKIEVDKTLQLADWRIRPLTDDLIDYARQDTHYLLYVWRRMKADLLAADDGEGQLLHSVFEASKIVCKTKYHKKVIDDNSHLPLFVQSNRVFNTQQMAALKMLFQWRDTEARLADESTSFILPNKLLLDLATVLPKEVEGVKSICRPHIPSHIEKNLTTIVDILSLCHELPLESISNEMYYYNKYTPKKLLSNHVPHTHSKSKKPDISADPKCKINKKSLPNDSNKTEENTGRVSTRKKHNKTYHRNRDISPYYRYSSLRSSQKGTKSNKLRINGAKGTGVNCDGPDNKQKKSKLRRRHRRKRVSTDCKEDKDTSMCSGIKTLTTA